MDTEAHNKVAIVTGGTKGIGHAIADRFANTGYRLVVCSRSAEDADRVATELSREPGQVVGINADMSAADIGQVLVTACIDHFGRLDCLVNNAGVFKPTPLDELTAEAWDETLNTNLRGAARVMREGSGCSVINLSSINGQSGEQDFAAYNASKAGLISLTMTSAIDLASKGIRVNCVAPGWTDTPMSSPWIGEMTQEAVDRMVPMGRIGTPDDIARVVLFLASNDAGYVTGQTITVDGGMLIRQPMI